MNKVVKTETVYADIRVYFQRTTYETAAEGSYTDLTLMTVNPLDSLPAANGGGPMTLTKKDQERYSRLAAIEEQSDGESTSGESLRGADAAAAGHQLLLAALGTSEQDYVPEMIMESTRRSDYLNALLNGASGVSTAL